MRCPKCGYNSFDHFDSCKKCGNDLVMFKQNYGIKSVLFPGDMTPDGKAPEAGADDSIADAAVAAVAAAASPTLAPAPETAAEASEADSDDFGFDFMGDTAEDDDLTFDELFEEAPEDEDIEETIEAPKAKSEDDDLDDDFGFDVDSDGGEDAGNDFSFDDEALEAPAEAEDIGTEEDPKSPFELPESSQDVRAPEASLDSFVEAGRTATVSVQDGLAETAELVAEADIESENYVFETAEAAEDGELFSVEKVAPVVEPKVAMDPVPAIVATQSVHASSQEVAPVDRFSTPTVRNCVSAFIYDLVILITVGGCFIVAAEAAMSTQATRLLPSLDTLINLSVPYFLVLFFLSFGYFTLFHFLAGQTPGKMLTGMRVETIDGEPLAFAQAFLRSVGGLLQLLPAGIGYILVMSNSERRGWNDKLAGTRVVVLSEASC